MSANHRAHDAALAWEVALPKKGRVSSWGVKPRATLLLWPDSPDEERMSIPTQVGRLLASKQRSGEVSPASRAELLYILGELSRSCARTRIERLIDRREYSSEEIRAKLKQDGYAQGTIDACVERAMEAGLVSDERFASAFIRSKLANGWGTLRISRELSHKGISLDDVAGWPEEFIDSDDEFSRAIVLARSKRVSGARAYERLVRYLCSKGYATGVAVRAAKQVMSEREENALVDF